MTETDDDQRLPPDTEPGTGGVGEGLMAERDWKRLVDQLKNGACTPLLGAGAFRPGFPAPAARDDPPDMAAPADRYGDAHPADQWWLASVLGRGPAAVRQRVVDDVRAAAPPDFGVQTEPHALLARLPLPVYLTTNYDGYLAAALRQAGRNPRSAVCPWYVGAERGAQEPDEFAEAFPNTQEPAVLHLYGSVEEPRSMVVTEEDHVELLLALAREQAVGRPIIPPAIRPALTSRPMLFLGHDPRDWSFRLLFHGLMRTAAAIEPRRRAVLQVDPLGFGDDQGERARRYLTSYFQRWNIAVFWGGLDEFCSALAARLGWT
ncbi:MAG: SIR2 family protein [Frankia sp.]|nr:SIR2 family protein [Frankia sp.]